MYVFCFCAVKVIDLNKFLFLVQRMIQTVQDPVQKFLIKQSRKLPEFLALKSSLGFLVARTQWNWVILVNQISAIILKRPVSVAFMITLNFQKPALSLIFPSFTKTCIRAGLGPRDWQRPLWWQLWCIAGFFIVFTLNEVNYVKNLNWKHLLISFFHK